MSNDRIDLDGTRLGEGYDEEPSSAWLAVASPSATPNIAARQPRSAQSCCATALAGTRRVEVVMLAVISILLFALSFRMFTGLFR